ncbi:hypothetical protein [Bacillus paranthracis]|uniref:hypothetical protein n=1 Tax=Bacillus paranthracis TaxID=2026186 RepID=UPI0021CE956B|nr:hypothetical protein [Bacillus paranthracis]MBR3120570.1 hypothetical protein [Oceanobacillus sp.]MCU5469540.1 hypothetical protein [Bacillus paranthracis]
MQLKQIDSKSFEVGIRSTRGDVTETFYKCPCGEGEVLSEVDYIVGRKNRQVICYCKECNEKYTFTINGTAELK